MEKTWYYAIEKQYTVLYISNQGQALTLKVSWNFLYSFL